MQVARKGTKPSQGSGDGGDGPHIHYHIHVHMPQGPAAGPITITTDQQGALSLIQQLNQQSAAAVAALRGPLLEGGSAGAGSPALQAQAQQLAPQGAMGGVGTPVQSPGRACSGGSASRTACFKCGKEGHWALDCPMNSNR